MTHTSVHKFLRCTSFSTSEDEETDPLQTVSSRFKHGVDAEKQTSQMMLRQQDNILDHEYRYRDGESSNFVISYCY